MANVSFTDHDIQAVSNAQKARILRDALPYIKEYNGKVVVDEPSIIAMDIHTNTAAMP